LAREPSNERDRRGGGTPPKKYLKGGKQEDQEIGVARYGCPEGGEAEPGDNLRRREKS